MKKGAYNILVDGMWGSCGKGLISTYLADKYRPDILVSTNMANAGHTAVNTDGRVFISKILPTPTILRTWKQGYSPAIMIGPSAAFHLPRILEEIDICKLSCPGVHNPLWIHKRAVIITQEHRDAEASLTTGTKHIGSTMQGCGTALSDKVMRRPNLKLASDYPELAPYLSDTNQALAIMAMLKSGATALHEGSQGFSLDIHHGSHYPHCTSRHPTATQCVADIGVSIRHVGDIYLVIRPYPIRVGNIIETDQTVGYSGGCYPDQEEISWQEVGESAGMPQDKIDELRVKELTTVTKRLRRVFTFSTQQLEEAVAVNGATRIALNFANYIDWTIAGANTPDAITDKVWQFINAIETAAGIPVTLVGTGPQLDNVIEL